jgi:hypothetical protein
VKNPDLFSRVILPLLFLDIGPGALSHQIVVKPKPQASVRSELYARQESRETSVPDPDAFRPPGSGSIIILYRSDPDPSINKQIK